jgi:hypothetical protein
MADLRVSANEKGALSSSVKIRDEDMNAIDRNSPAMKRAAEVDWSRR